VEPKRTAANCKWARPTISLPSPIWLEAWNSPWTCVRDEKPRPLEDTTVCSDCPRWELKRSDGSTD
jgi:hypothetical protein